MFSNEKYKVAVDLSKVTNFHFNENIGLHLFNGSFYIPEIDVTVDFFAQVDIRHHINFDDYKDKSKKFVRTIKFFIGYNKISDNMWQNISFYDESIKKFRSLNVWIDIDKKEIARWVMETEVHSTNYEPKPLPAGYELCEDNEGIVLDYYSEDNDNYITLKMVTKEDTDTYVDGPEDPQEWFDHPFTYDQITEERIGHTKEGYCYIIPEEDADKINEQWKKEGQEAEENREPPEPDYDDYDSRW